MKKISSQQLGISGEYFVAAELTRRGFIASITLRNSEGVDIICTLRDLSKSFTIQVKTSSGAKPKWILSSKAENMRSETFFYVFVLLSSVELTPQYFIVPSKVVAEYVKNRHINWLSLPKSNGEQRKDSDMRNFLDEEFEYKDAWSLLK